MTHFYTLPAYCPHVYQHFPTHLRPPCYHPSSLYHHPCLHPCRNCTHSCLGLATARPQLVFRSLTVATVPRRLATICSLVYCYSATAVYILFTCLFALLCSPISSLCLTSWVQPLCSPRSIFLTFCVSPRSPALPPVPYASPLSLPAGSTTLTAR